MATKKQAFEVYHVVAVKDAYAHVQDIQGNRKFNTRDAQAYFKENGVTIYELVAPVEKLSERD